MFIPSSISSLRGRVRRLHWDGSASHVGAGEDLRMRAGGFSILR